MSTSFLGIIYFVALSHGLMLLASLWKKSSKGQPGRWLCLIALIICYKLYEGGALYTGLYTYVAHTMALLPGEVLFIGPLIWLYSRQVTGRKAFSPGLLALHFIPAAAIWMRNAPGVFRAAEGKIAMWDSVLADTGGVLPVQYIVLLLAIKAHLSIYLLLSWRNIHRMIPATQALRADNSERTLTQVQFMVVAFFILEVIWIGLFIAQQFFDVGTLSSVGDVWLLFVAAMVLGLGFVGLQKPDLVFSPEECKLLEQHEQTPPSNEPEDEKIKYLHSALPESTSELLAKELERKIQEQQLFLDDKLTLTDLSKATDIKAHTLSQVINQSMKTNFYRLINGYRVQHAVDLIEDPGINWSLERIAFESGFSNRVTFSKAFKEVMGSTPSGYKKELQQKAQG